MDDDNRTLKTNWLKNTLISESVQDKYYTRVLEYSLYYIQTFFNSMEAFPKLTTLKFHIILVKLKKKLLKNLSNKIKILVSMQEERIQYLSILSVDKDSTKSLAHKRVIRQ